MSQQLFLDPTATQDTQKTWVPDQPIPLAIRKFGFYPELEPLHPGDLLLFSAIEPDFIQRSIRTVQKKGGYADDHARWEHAAVYIGSGALCEANRKGVVVSDILEYVETHLIRIRRNLKLNKDQRWAIAVNALKLQHYSYGYISIAQLLWKSNVSGFWGNANFSYPKRALICSELYVDAHTKASENIVLGNIASSEFTPVSLSMESLLTDIKTDWLQIV